MNTHIRKTETTGTIVVSYLFTKTTDATLPIPTISGSAVQRVSAFTTISSPEEIEEREWMAIVSKPRVIRRLRELGRQALEEDLAGETEEGGFDCL
jgi:hypothetical protein